MYTPKRYFFNETHFEIIENRFTKRDETEVTALEHVWQPELCRAEADILAEVKVN